MSNTVLDALLEARSQREQVALLTVISATGAHKHALGRHCVLWSSPERECVGDLELRDLSETVLDEARSVLATRNHQTLSFSTNEGDIQVFVEVQKQSPHLLIVGAGHIAVPLAQMASLCDFRVTVMDDRRQYANSERFPNADQVIAGTVTDELKNLRQQTGFDKDTYVVLVTRGHQHDLDALIELVEDPLAYIGMIGSKRRVKAVFQLMQSEFGIAPTQLNHVYAPIGIDIGAHSPAEISVCIMAEIINVMRGGPAVSLSDQLRTRRQRHAE